MYNKIYVKFVYGNIFLETQEQFINNNNGNFIIASSDGY